MNKAIIFDLDGTIVKTEHLWLQAATILLKKRSITIPQKEYEEFERRLNGLDVRSTVILMKKRYMLSDSLYDLYKELSDLAHNLYKTGLIIVPGFQTFITRILQQRIPVAIATNSDRATTDIIVKALNLKHYFGSHIYTIEDVQGKGKPKPDLYLFVAQKLDVLPKHCLVIEDSALGIKAAHAADMHCIGINSHGDASQLQNADAIVTNYEEISPEMIDRYI